MPYFTSAYVKFFKDLKKNNSSAWFAAHRDTYEKEVKDPFAHLVDDVLAALTKKDKTYASLRAKDCVFRINRDIRFAKDKSPYKTHMAAYINPEGKKGEGPGFYFSLGADEQLVGGGRHELTPEALYKVRQEIAYHGAEFNTIIKAKSFISKYTEVQGEELKTAPKEFKEETEKLPILKKKQFYCMAYLPSDAPTRNDLLKVLLSYYDAALPLNQFLQRALS